MRNSSLFGQSDLSAAAPSSGKKRRPAGISRRQKRRLSFEPLEDRRVMSADTTTALAASVNQSLNLQASSYSSDDLAGYLAILQNEMVWQQLQEAAAAGSTVALVTNAIPNDPLLAQQWHLINSGQLVSNPDYQPIFAKPNEDINVAGAWNLGYTGAGVRVAVIDSGVQLNHPDLAGNIDSQLGYDAIDGDTNASARIIDPRNNHGTAVAGIIAAVANNGIGGSGIAPAATIIPIRLIDPDAYLTSPKTEQEATVDAFRYATQYADITNNSWGPGISRGIVPLTALELSALRDSVFFGRNGLGVIHVFSSGNDAGANFDNSGGPDYAGVDFLDVGNYDSASYDGWANSRYVIAVTGVDEDGSYNNPDGTVTGYPEAGPSVLVAAPTGSNAGYAIGDDIGLGSGIVTTDYTGNLGYNAAPNTVTGAETEDPFFPVDRDFLAETDYTSRMNGTSASAPMVSGVIALMLEANPNLTWRDVQEILVRSSRQNMAFETPTYGFGVSTQNLWLVNQMTIFQSPDPYDPAIDPAILTQSPTSDPNIRTQGFYDHFAPQVQSYTNGAGYTVSQGTGAYGEQIGYAHGVVDATLAVQLAAQWATKGQALPNERTYTTSILEADGDDINIPGAEVGSEDSGYQLVPGKLGGDGGFIAFWNEYFADTPDFSQDFPAQGSDLPMNVSANNTMALQTVEVKVSISGSQAAALDHLRLVLVSPEGVQSELNNYWIQQLDPNQTLMNISPSNVVGEPNSQATSSGNLVYTFTTNRNWGERTDNAIVFDPTTGLPVVDQSGLLNSLFTSGFGVGGTGTTITPGSALKQGWRLVFENYGSTDLGLGAVEVAWHGSPIGANTKRIQGFVGVDGNRDDNFNFSRVTDTVVGDIDGNPSVTRFGEVVNTLDDTPLVTNDSWGANVTVVARRASDGSVVAQFVTGADGNYYFDLVPDDYIIQVEDPLARTAVEDTQTGGGLLQHFKNEWRITKDWFNVWDRTASLEVPVDANGTPLPWHDNNGSITPNHVKNINFLLDPGAPPAKEAVFSGVVFADTNADSLFNSNDVNLSNVVVYGDVNRNGFRDAGEPFVQTGANGQYSLTVPLTGPAVLNVSVERPANWTITKPNGGIVTQFSGFGDKFTGVDFAIAPPANSAPGIGLNQPGILLGVVYEDAIAPQGSRQTGEAGVPNVTVYIDANNSGLLDGGDISTVTNQFGAFAFTNVAPASNLRVRIVVASPLIQTIPLVNGPYPVDLASGDTVSGIAFGIKNQANLDYGDLPASYDVTAANVSDPARHTKGAYFLGTAIDAELQPQGNLAATGDDLAGFDDDDGITLPQLVSGTNTMSVVASRNGGYLTGWIDFNGNGKFDASERLTMTRNGVTSTKTLLTGGSNVVTFEVPAGVVASTLYARFRFGEFNIDAPTGAAQIGEVEDYLLPVAAVAPASVFINPDASGNGLVDGSDFLAWQRNSGKSSGATTAQGDSNSDGKVNSTDLGNWKSGFGTVTLAAGLVAATGDFTADGAAAGDDFLAWQRGFGKTSGVNIYMGDGNSDGKVDGSDLVAWRAEYGGVGFTASVATGATVAAASVNSLFAAAPLPNAATVDAALSSDDLVSVARCAATPASAVASTNTGTAPVHGERFARHAAPDFDFDQRDSAFGDFAVNRRGWRRRDVTSHDDSDDDALTEALDAAVDLAI